MTERYDNLASLMAKRQQKLADSLRDHQLLGDIEREEAWIRDRDAVISGRGRDIGTVRQLLKETQQIMTEIQTHEPAVQKVVQTAQKLANSGQHGQAEVVRQSSRALAEHWVEFKEKGTREVD